MNCKLFLNPDFSSLRPAATGSLSVRDSNACELATLVAVEHLRLAILKLEVLKASNANAAYMLLLIHQFSTLHEQQSITAILYTKPRASCT